jgi:hypothetical protein
MENHWVKCSTRFRRVTVCVDPVSTARFLGGELKETGFFTKFASLPRLSQNPVSGQQSTVNSQQSTVNSQQSTVNSQQSTVNSQQSTVNQKKMLPSIEGSYSNKAFYCLSKLLD